MRGRARGWIVVLPGWWYEVACGLAGTALLGVLLMREPCPNYVGLLAFTGLLLAAHNSQVIVNDDAAVSPAFMIVMASIAGFGAHGALLGSAIIGFSAG